MYEWKINLYSSSTWVMHGPSYYDAPSPDPLFLDARKAGAGEELESLVVVAALKSGDGLLSTSSSPPVAAIFRSSAPTVICDHVVQG